MTTPHFTGEPSLTGKKDDAGALPIAPNTMVRLRRDAGIWQKHQGVSVKVQACRLSGDGGGSSRWLVRIQWPGTKTVVESSAGFFEPVLAPAPPAPIPPPPQAAGAGPSGRETPGDRMARMAASREWGTR